jgi:hypothetical protein
MAKIYRGRKSTRSAGFIMTAVSAFLSLGLVAMFLIGLINNTPKGTTNSPPFNWSASLLVLAGALGVWLILLVVLARFMRNTPRTVRLEEDRLLVDSPQGREVEIPYSSLSFIRKSDVPVYYWKYEASFRGVLIHYRDGQNTERDYYLSTRDTTSFDELLEDLLALTPNRHQPKTKVTTADGTEQTQKEVTIE